MFRGVYALCGAAEDIKHVRNSPSANCPYSRTPRRPNDLVNVSRVGAGPRTASAPSALLNANAGVGVPFISVPEPDLPYGFLGFSPGPRGFKRPSEVKSTSKIDEFQVVIGIETENKAKTKIECSIKIIMKGVTGIEMRSGNEIKIKRVPGWKMVAESPQIETEVRIKSGTATGIEDERN
ncbi:hypothetical protein EVAR_25430_1 [Eumeta japonica]|uniref:Uncharacterized protein n=1 Tax=Eumeta variegata TaxID=151549 RepID=A0A4C1V4U1_EUMVA|nr:hypothetical protein EVAR_25430_1 [Eumeta japonica]